MLTPLVPHAGSVAGGALVMYGQLAALAARHEVTLVTLAGPDPSDRAGLDTLKGLGVEVHAVWRDAPGGVRRWGARSRLALQWLRGFEPVRTLKFQDRRIPELIERLGGTLRFDVIQIEDNAMGAYAYPARVPTVLTEHEVRATPHEPERRRWIAYQRRVWSRFDRLQVFTELDAAAVRSIAPEIAGRIRVNPFGIAAGPAADPALEVDGEVVFVGGFQHRPNVDAALWLGREIFPGLCRLHPSAHLTIVGSDPPRAVRALAGGAVAVTGRVPRVEPYLERAAVVVAPIRTGGGMRLKVLQAMALGKAVVTTPLGAQGLVSYDHAPPLVVVQGGPEMAERMAGLLAARGRRLALGQRARAFVLEHHGWQAYLERLGAIYAELGLAA